MHHVVTKTMMQAEKWLLESVAVRMIYQGFKAMSQFTQMANPERPSRSS